MNLERNLITSVKQLKNLVLFVPDISMIIFSTILGIGFFKKSGFNQIVQSATVAESFQMDLFKTLLADQWATVALSIALFFVITFFIGVGVDLLRFSLITELMKGKKRLKLVKCWEKSKDKFLDVVVVKILVFLLSLGLVLIGLAIGFPLSYIPNAVVSGVLIGLVALGGLIAMIILRLHLLFRYPLLFLEKHMPPVNIIKSSFMFTKRNFSKVLLMFLMMIAIFVAFFVITSPINILLGWFEGHLPSIWYGVILAYFVSVIKSSINIVYAMWVHLFVFNSYVDKKK